MLGWGRVQTGKWTKPFTAGSLTAEFWNSPHPASGEPPWGPVWFSTVAQTCLQMLTDKAEMVASRVSLGAE